MYSNIMNPYAQYNSLSNATSPIVPGQNPFRVFGKGNNTMVPVNEINEVVLGNTHLPRQFYDDVIDNLELMSLNFIGDLKSLIKKHSKLKQLLGILLCLNLIRII